MPSAKKTKLPDFEDSMQELEVILDDLETSDVRLEELIKRFERGSALIKNCRELLGDASKRIELLKLEGQTKTENSLDQKGAKSHESTVSDAPASATDDDIELF